MPDYIIELAQPEHVVFLPSIERAAAEVFPAGMIPDKVKESVMLVEYLEEAQSRGQLWVALTAGDQPIGFAMVTDEGNEAMLAEIDVHPDHQKKGLGRRLVLEAVQWAYKAGYQGISLTTFKDIPWNAPFYESIGFRQLNRKELSTNLHSILNNEEKLGLTGRVAMYLDFRGVEQQDSRPVKGNLSGL
jgi:GNAT superfamily N-acetyltransferase